MGTSHSVRLRRGLIAAALLLGGCADFGAPVNDAAAPVSAEEARLQAIESRLADIGRRVENLNLAALSQDTTRLEAEVRGLRGEVERLTFLVESGDKRGKDLYVDLDKRIQLLENERRAAKLTMDNAIANAPPAPAAAPSQEEESTYLQVFDLLKSGRYDDAIIGFRGMLERWPSGRYADNAWYWLGESYYVKKDFAAAQSSFHTLLENFANSPKRPDAMLKLGMTQYELKQVDQARQTLQKLIDEFPKSNAAALARSRLEQLK
ncbi:MAG: tol-pal system protein YbgF [Gammaproteobacteria bacterium]|nr:tol-pal system protein YbgF [Gammaproteobacteria bacterium]